jgi:hypothetical protein
MYELSFRRHLKLVHVKNLDAHNHNFAVVLSGYETWSLTLREEHRLRVFENRMQRRISEPGRRMESPL